MLLANEEIKFQTRPLAFKLVTGSAAFGLLGVWLLPQHYYMSGIIFLAIFASWLRFKSKSYTVTNLRVFAKNGYPNPVTTEIYLKQIESVQFEKDSVWGLNSVLIIKGIGGTQVSFKGLKNSELFKRYAQEQLASAQGFNKLA